MHSTKMRGFLFGSAMLALASLGYTRSASASSSFPAALKDALEKRFPGTTYCVPLCTACHTVTTGGPGNYNSFGKNLNEKGMLYIPNPVLVEGAVNKLLDLNLDSDGDGKSDNDELKALESPSISGPGSFCTDLAYGCGARIAPAPPALDKVGLFSAGLVVLGLTLLRRRRR